MRFEKGGDMRQIEGAIRSRPARLVFGAGLTIAAAALCPPLAAEEPKLSPETWAELPPLPAPDMGDVDAGWLPQTAPAPALSPATTAPKVPDAAAGLGPRLKWEGTPANPADPGSAGAATSLGVKYKLQPDIMIGVLAQFEQATSAGPGGPSSSEQPWMAGPVATVQLAPGLALDARAAWGSNDTGAADRALGIATMERRLLDAKLASTQTFGPWRFSPSVTLNYAAEKPEGAAGATHDALAARATGAGRIAVTPEVAYRIEMPQAMFIEPKAAVGSFWDIEDLSRLAPHAAGHEDVRLKAGAGVTIGKTGGGKLEVGGAVEGGGPAAPDVWSGRLQLSVPLE
jgi:hypothetical protein